MVIVLVIQSRTSGGDRVTVYGVICVRFQDLNVYGRLRTLVLPRVVVHVLVRNAYVLDNGIHCLWEGHLFILLASLELT